MVTCEAEIHHVNCRAEQYEIALSGFPQSGLPTKIFGPLESRSRNGGIGRKLSHSVIRPTAPLFPRDFGTSRIQGNRSRANAAGQAHFSRPRGVQKTSEHCKPVIAREKNEPVPAREQLQFRK